MGRLALIAMAVLVWIGASQEGFAVPDALDGKLWLVALFPAIYILGLALLRE